MKAAGIVRLLQLGPNTAPEMLYFPQTDNLRRQDFQRAGLPLHPLTDILHHQHIFALVLIVGHQPATQTLRLAIVRMAGNGSRQRFGTQQRPATPPQPFRRRPQKGLLRVKDHQEVEAVKVAAAAGRHNRSGV